MIAARTDSRSTKAKPARKIPLDVSLGIPRYQALGIEAGLKLCKATSAEEIAAELEWEGNPKTLLDACIGAGLLRSDGKKPKGAPEVVVPSELDTPEFRAAWVEWLAYRKEKKKPMTERTVKLQFKDLIPLGPVAAAECVLLSIRQGWTGLFPEKVGQHGNGNAIRAGQRHDPKKPVENF